MAQAPHLDSGDACFGSHVWSSNDSKASASVLEDLLRESSGPAERERINSSARKVKFVARATVAPCPLSAAVSLGPDVRYALEWEAARVDSETIAKREQILEELTNWRASWVR